MCNLEIYHCLSALEHHVYGVLSQYERINENLVALTGPVMGRTCGIQATLDIYYYTLTWDKLRKIFLRLKELVNRVMKDSPNVPNGFKAEYKQVRSRIEHLFDELQVTVRDEYEHPSLQMRTVHNIMEWGTLLVDGSGNVKVHVGGDEYAVVRREHVDRLKHLWITLIDTFIKHFSQKPTSADLFLWKKQIEDSIDGFVCDYLRLRRESKHEDANHLLNQYILADLYLSMEDIPLSQEVKNKLYSTIWTAPEDHT